MPINKKIGFLNIILFVLFLILVMLFCSCGGGGGGGGASGSSNTTPTTPTATQNWEEEENCTPEEVTLPRFMDFSDDGLTISDNGRRLVLGLDSADDFYDFSTIKRIDLIFSQGNWWTLLTNNYQSETEIPATMSYYNAQNIQKTLAAPVGVRFKGDTSYRQNVANPQTGYNGQKKSFNISIDYQEAAQEVDGFNSLNFNCAWGDETFMREVIYEHINKKYIPAASVNYVDLYIHDPAGEHYWGIYINSQQLDNNFIKEWFTSKNGSRWRAESPGTATGGFNTGKASLNYLGDTLDYYTPYYTLKRYCSESTLNPWDDLIEVCDVLQNSSDLENETSQVLDLDRTLWFLAMETIFGDEDSYVNKGGMDYYVYWDYSTDLLTPLEVDGNSTLLKLGIGGGGPVLPGGGGGRGNFLTWDPYANKLTDTRYPLINKLLNVPSIRQRYLAHMRTVLNESFNEANMNNIIDAYAAKIETYINDDPNTFITDFASAVTGLKEAVTTRCDTLWSNAELNVTGLTVSDVNWKVDGVEWATPSSSDEVTINASVTDPASVGINSVYAYIGEGLVDPFTKVQMDDLGGGLFTTTLPENASGARIRFYIEAIAGNPAGTRTYYPAGAEHDVFTFQVN